MVRFKAVILLLIVVLFVGCGKEDTPEDAFRDIQSAVFERNFDNLAKRLDTEVFFGRVYDDITAELVKNCADYGLKYPNDPYFQHDRDFIEQYNLKHRELHLEFLSKATEAYFANIAEPEKPEDNPHAYVACEFAKILKASKAVIKSTVVNENHATMTVEMQGDSSLRGGFIGKLVFELGFDFDGGVWKLTSIENCSELTPALVDKAEVVWITFF